MRSEKSSAVVGAVSTPREEFLSLVLEACSVIAESAPADYLRCLTFWDGYLVGQEASYGVILRLPKGFIKGKFGVYAKRGLPAFLERCGGDSVSISYGEGHLAFTSEGGCAKFNVLEEASLSMIEMPKKFFPLGDDLADIIGSVAFCALKSSEANVLTGVYLSGRGVAAADGVRLAIRGFSWKDFGRPLVISSKAVSKLVSWGRPKSWARTPSALWFQWEDRWLWCRLMAVDFPDVFSIYEQVRKERGIDIIYEPDEMSSGVELVLQSTEASYLALSVSKAEVKLSCQVESKAAASSSIPCKASGSVEFLSHASRLSEAVSRFSKVRYTEGQALVFSGGTVGLGHVLMTVSEGMAESGEGGWDADGKT